MRHPRNLLDRPGVLRSPGGAKTTSSEENWLRAWLRPLLRKYQDEDENPGQWKWSKARFELTKAVESDVPEVAARKPAVLREAREGCEKSIESVSLADLIDGNMFLEGDRDKENRV
jgi:hypothetical protein